MTKKLTGTVDEAAEALGISRKPAIRVGKRILVLWGPLMRKLGAGDEEAA